MVSSGAMRIVLLVTAILAIALAFGYSRKVGAALLIVVVLGMLFTAKRKGLI